MIVVLMGVSGSGKSTIGALLASRLCAPFVDADDFHTPANKAKMAAGEPLNDADRAPWLHTLQAVLHGWWTRGENGVMACSALKNSYRQTLAAGTPPAALRFVLLEGSRELIAARLAARRHEFMNARLLDSQLATLEAPAAGALHVVNDRTPDEVVAGLLDALGVEGAQQ